MFLKKFFHSSDLNNPPQFSKENSSGLEFGTRPVFFIFFSAVFLSPKKSPREFESFFLFCENAVFRSVKNFFWSMPFLEKKSSEMFVIFIIAESTFGFGQNADAGVFFTISGFPYACTDSAKRFICGGRAMILSATSF